MFVENYEKKVAERGNGVEEPVFGRARKARVLRLQEELDRCSEALIGDFLFQYTLYIFCYYRCLSDSCSVDGWLWPRVQKPDI